MYLHVSACIMYVTACIHMYNVYVCMYYLYVFVCIDVYISRCLNIMNLVCAFAVLQWLHAHLWSWSCNEYHQSTCQRMLAISGACATVTAPWAQGAPCSTSTPGPWFGRLTTRQWHAEKWKINFVSECCTRVLLCSCRHISCCSTFSGCFAATYPT